MRKYCPRKEDLQRTSKRKKRFKKERTAQSERRDAKADDDMLECYKKP